MTALFDVFVLDRAVAGLLQQAMAGSVLGPLDYAIYSAVADQPGCTATELARRMNVPLTTMADWLGPGVERGHLDRQPSEKDRRSFGYELTADGHQIRTEAMVAFGKAYLAFGRHTQRPMDELRVVMRDMINAAEAAAEELAGPNTPGEVTSRRAPSRATRATRATPAPRSRTRPRTR